LSGEKQVSDSVFVTGGTGFLGRHLVPMLSRAGYHVRVLTRKPEASSWLLRCQGVEVVHGDVLDPEPLKQGIRDSRFVVHAGGLFRFWGDEADFDRTNVGGAENMLQAARQAGVERFIHISTVALIGHPDPNRLVDETHPVEPADAYQRSKLRAEQVVSRHAGEGVPVIILRPGAYYGPLGHYAFNRLFFKDPMRGIIMQINGGRYITFPAYIGGVAQAILNAFTRGRLGEIYNICDESLTHREAFDIICEEGNIRFPRLTIPGWMGVAASHVLEGIAAVTKQEPFWPLNLKSYVYNYWRVSNQKARLELGFVPTDFREGARRTLAWYRAGQPEDIPETECQ
jgi:dihydroflavonol-4-reductase